MVGRSREQKCCMWMPALTRVKEGGEMIIDLELDDEIYNKLDSMSNEKGITVKELIRWVIGDYIQYNLPRHISYPVPITPSPVEQGTAKVMKLSELLIKGMINQGAIKCHNCTLALTLADLEQGKCSNCEAEI